MLVLSRKKGEAILIGDEIRIVVVECCHGHKARLGIEAPLHVRIHREEIYLANQAENEEATT